MKNGPKAPIAVHEPLGISYHPNGKASVTVDCLEKQFIYHDPVTKTMSDGWILRIQALLASVDDTPWGKLRPRDIQKLLYSLKLRRACGLDGIPNECLRRVTRRPPVHLTYLFYHGLGLSYFPKHWKQAKVILLPILTSIMFLDIIHRLVFI
jgi:hypothetical protein